MHNKCNYTTEANSFIQAFIMFIIIYQANRYSCRKSNTQEILILKGACLATNYVATTFHPTIGQWAHQSLSGTATPEMGMIPTRNMETLEDSHITKDTTKTQPSQHSWVYQAAKELERMTAKLVSSTTELWTPAPDLAWILEHLHTQHKEAPPFFAT